MKLNLKGRVYKQYINRKMNRFTSLIRNIKKLDTLGDELLRTHAALANTKSQYTLDKLHKRQECRIEEFEKTMEHAINDWRREDLNKYWTGYS